MVIKIINFDKCLKSFGDISGIDITPEISEATKKVMRSARDLSPVDTGALKGSIKSKVKNRGKSNVTGIVFTVLEYAPHQEFGTVKMEAQPFMRPAININRVGIYQSLKKYIREEIKKRT